MLIYQMYGMLLLSIVLLGPESEMLIDKGANINTQNQFGKIVDIHM